MQSELPGDGGVMMSDFGCEDFRDLDKADDPQAGLQRLDTVGGLAPAKDYKSQTFEMLEVRPGQTILDVGCGTGDDARALGALVGARGRVIGVDNSEAAIAEAMRRSEGSTAPVEFRLGDALELNLPSDEFDCARADRVLQHVEDPSRALDELVRVTRPGGKVAVFEPDWDALVVDSSDRQITREIVRCNADVAVRNGWIGRQLWAMFLNVGLAHVEVRGIVAVVTSFPIANDVLFLTRSAEKAVDASRITGQQATQWLDLLKNADQAGRFFASLNGYMVAGRKPQTD